MNIDKTTKSINIPARKITGESVLSSSAAAAAKRNPSSPVQSALSPKMLATATAQASKLSGDKQTTALEIIANVKKMKQPTETTKF